MFKTRGGGQRPFEQFSKKMHNWCGMASLINVNILQPLHVVEDPERTKWQKV